MVEDAQSGNFDRRQQTLSNKEYYRTTSRSHIRPSDGSQQRCSRSMDLTPVVEQPKYCATTPGVVIPDGARGLLCGPVFSSAITLAGEKFSPTIPATSPVAPRVLPREISMSADNLPSLCLNDYSMTVTPMTKLNKMAVAQERHSPSSDEGQASDCCTSQDSRPKTPSTQSSGQLGKDKKTSSAVFHNTSTSSTSTEPEDSVTRKLRERQSDVALNSDRTMTLDSGYDTVTDGGLSVQKQSRGNRRVLSSQAASSCHSTTLSREPKHMQSHSTLSQGIGGCMGICACTSHHERASSTYNHVPPMTPAHTPIGRAYEMFRSQITPECVTPTATLSDCASKGVKYFDETNDFGLEIPEGAIPEGDSITIDVGVALYGPFQYPEGLRPVSPVFWVCVRDQKLPQFLKPVKVTIPHFLNLESSEDIESLGLTFLKGDHEMNSQQMHQFEPAEGKKSFKCRRIHGVLETTHFCYLCISGKLSHELIQKAMFCIYAAIPPLMPPKEPSYINVFLTFLLSTCIATVRKQISFVPELQTHRSIMQVFQFCSKDEEDPAIEIVLPQSPPDEWTVGWQFRKKVSF